VNSRAKGKRGELEFAKFCREVLGLEGARRTQQYCGSDGVGDVTVPGLDVHWEVKRPKTLPVQTRKYMEQALSDARLSDVPVVTMREDGGDWLLMLRAEDLMGLAERCLKHEEGLD